MSQGTRSFKRSRWPLWIGLVIGLASAVTYLSMRTGQTGRWVIPGEFEDQQALILAWEKLPRQQGDMNYLVPQRQVLADIIAASYRTIRVIILVSDEESRQSAGEALSERDVPLSEVTFVDLPFDSIWIRDYGPICVKSGTGQVQWRDHQYVMTAEGWIDAEGKQFTRSSDAGVTGELANMTGIPSQEVPLVLYGGGISSNGEGLLLVASDIVKWNKDRYGYSRERITDLLKEHYGARQVVYLDVLKGEPTGHLDVFATFLAADMVVIGSYPRFHDPRNSLLLDANAERLVGIQTSSGPLKVVRVTMAPHDSRFFGGTYANVVFANGTLLVPSYGIDQDQDALQTYQRLLPDWNVIPIDCGALIIGEGAAHCVTLNLQTWPSTLKHPPAESP